MTQRRIKNAWVPARSTAPLRTLACRAWARRLAAIAPILLLGCLGTRQTQAAGLLAEFETGKQGRMLIVAAEVAGKKVKLLLDTGADGTGFDVALRTKLGEVRGTITVETSGGRVETDRFDCPPIRLGTLGVRTDQPVFVQDFRDLSSGTDQNVAGVLGMDVLSQYVLQVDFDGGKVRLFDELPGSPEELGTAVDLSFQGRSRPHVSAKCGELKRDFLLDTGASETSIDKATFDLLAERKQLRLGPTRLVNTTAGQVSSRLGVLHEMQIGPLASSDILCDEDRTSALGLRYLSRFLLTLDFPHGKLYLRKGKDFARADSTGAIGVMLTRVGTRFVIQSVKPGGPADKAGLQAGDELLEIAGRDTAELDVFTIGRSFTSEVGRKLSLKIGRNGKRIETSIVIGDRFAE